MSELLVPNQKVTLLSGADTIIRAACPDAPKRYPWGYILWIHIHWILVYDIIGVGTIQSAYEDGFGGNRKKCCLFLTLAIFQAAFENFSPEKPLEWYDSLRIVMWPRFLDGQLTMQMGAQRTISSRYGAIASRKNSVLIWFEMRDESTISTVTCGIWEFTTNHISSSLARLECLRDLQPICHSNNNNIRKCTVIWMSINMRIQCAIHHRKPR